eukprot:GHVN01003892.1.p1 GENE.GHVN01003892.1~~GHVN01003892.1.p1  ORF type:complete len:700 (+),score=110.24 GHVN01003892.1:606-2705(+)
MVTTSVQEDSTVCGSLGSWEQLVPEGPAPVEGCPHVLEHRGPAQHRTFTWTAPECGCVTISAVVVTEAGEFYTDDDDKLQGPLTMTLCSDDDEEDNNQIATTYDADFYGIEEENKEEDVMHDIIDEVTDLITDGEDVDEDLTEDEDDDESEERGHRRGHWKKHGKGRGKGRWNKKDKADEDDEENDESDGKSDRKGKGRGKWMKKDKADEDDKDNNESEEASKQGYRGRKRAGKAKRWMRKMGRKVKTGQKSEVKRSARLEKVCSLIAKKADAPVQVRALEKSVLTQEALDARREHWTQYRQDMLLCCRNEEDEEELPEVGEEDVDDEDQMVKCFQETHGKRIVEKMCGATDEHFKKGNIPSRIADAKAKCCEAQGEEEQRECLMDAMKVMKKMKRQHKRTTQMDGKARVSAICKRVEKNPVPNWHKNKLGKLPVVQKNKWTTLFTERRLQVTTCCKVEDEEEQEACLTDLREQRLDRVCQGEEPLTPPWSKRDPESTVNVTNECCVLQDEERYECFDEKLQGGRGGRHGGGPRGARGPKGHRGPRGRHAHRRGHREEESTEEVMDEQSAVGQQQVQQDEKRARPAFMKNRRAEGMRRKGGKSVRQCCDNGRKAGLGLGGDVEKTTEGASHWKVCNKQARSYLETLEGAAENSKPQSWCQKSFRKCCMRNVIRRTREEAVDEAVEQFEEKQDLAVEGEQ